jgi:hypothetical protein
LGLSRCLPGSGSQRQKRRLWLVINDRSQVPPNIAFRNKTQRMPGRLNSLTTFDVCLDSLATQMMICARPLAGCSLRWRR